MRRIQSAIKRAEIAERNRRRNQAVKSAFRTAIKKALAMASASDATAEAKKTALGKAYGIIDRAILKGILHKNTGARYKSRVGLAMRKALAA
jgi:small subunit ribosomal protein S20